jgi:cAMP phosphodiesterase
MKIRVIGCHGSVEPGYQTSCYLINERFFIDAGSICTAFTPVQQEKITDVFLTHPHLDHVKDLCFLIENSASPERPPLVLHSTSAILDDVHKHVFNDVIWPDFSKVSLRENPEESLLRFSPLDSAMQCEMAGVSLQAFPVNHPGHAIGYLLDDGNNQILFTGDTGPCAKVWEVANSAPRLKAIFTEISFPSRMDRLARVSGHYTLEQLTTDLVNLKSSNIPIYISHFKPRFMRELMDEFHRRAPPQLKLMHEGDEFIFD